MIPCGVIICTRNRPDDLMRALESLSVQTYPVAELIIVDSSNQPVTDHSGVLSWFDTFSSRHAVRFLYLHTKPGLPYQRNIGISNSQADVIYFFDDDVQLMPDYIERMQQIYQDFSHYAGGMGNVCNVGQKPSWKYRLFRTFFLLQQDYADGTFTASGMPTHVFGTDQFRAIQVLSGCCMSYRRAVLSQFAFDEALNGYAYMEDCDMSYRVAQQHPLFFNPAARLYHFHSPVSRDSVVKNRAMLMRNYRYLFFKNFYPTHRYAIIAYYWSLLGLFIEALILRRFDYCKGYWQGLRS